MWLFCGIGIWNLTVWSLWKIRFGPSFILILFFDYCMVSQCRFRSFLSLSLGMYSRFLIFFSTWKLFWNILVFNVPEKAMAPHSSTLTWKIPWTEEPGRLQSTGSWRVRHNWATSLSLFTFMHWRRKWQPTPVFLPGESQGWGSLVGYRLWGHPESDTTEMI